MTQAKTNDYYSIAEKRELESFHKMMAVRTQKVMSSRKKAREVFKQMKSKTVK